METRDNKKLDGLTRVPVRLVFDTAEFPLAEGVRYRDVTSRHLLYEAEGLFVDLRLERDPRGFRTSLVGQIVDRRDPQSPVTPTPVFLLQEDRMVESAATNGLGEFQLEIEPQRSMRLCLAVPGGRLFEVPLDRRMTRRPGEDGLDTTEESR